MFRKRFLCLALAAVCVAGAGVSAMAAEVDCDSTYCFAAGDFQPEEEAPLVGICVSSLPDAATGTVMLGTRVLQPGDILTAEQLSMLTFVPLRTESDQEAVLTYLPIYENRVDKAAEMIISVRGKEDKAPVAQDSAIETYKNLPNEGMLKVSDPEGENLTYTLLRSPKRGQVELRSDGTFVYTPKKNKVGVDSFTFTAVDPAGNVSREATVTIQILKPADSKQYTDTVGSDCRFAAEWMRNTGLFEGEKIGGQLYFHPEDTVTRGEFLAMMLQALEIPAQQTALDALPADTPQWLKPYLAAAMRAGLTAGLPDRESGSFDADAPMTLVEAAVMLQNALDLSVSQQMLEQENTQQIPVWAAASVMALQDNGVELPDAEVLTRGQVAQILYQICHLSVEAPGLAVLRLQ